MTKIVRRRSSAVRNKKLIVTWPDGNSHAEFAFGETEIENAAIFALRYAMKLKQHVLVQHGRETVLSFDGPRLSRLPKRPPREVVSGPELQREAAAHKNPKRKVVRRRK